MNIKLHLAVVLTLGLSACSATVKDKPSQAVIPNQSMSEKISKPHVKEDTRIKSFTAYGVGKTPWRAEVKGNANEKGNKLMLEGENIYTVEFNAERSAYSKGVEFSGSANGIDITLNIHSEICKDNQGNKTEFKATLHYGKKVLEGCAVAGAIEQAPT